MTAGLVGALGWPKVGVRGVERQRFLNSLDANTVFFPTECLREPSLGNAHSPPPYLSGHRREPSLGNARTCQEVSMGGAHFCLCTSRPRLPWPLPRPPVTVSKAPSWSVYVSASMVMLALSQGTRRSVFPDRRGCKGARPQPLLPTGAVLGAWPFGAAEASVLELGESPRWSGHRDLFAAGGDTQGLAAGGGGRPRRGPLGARQSGPQPRGPVRR